MAGCLPCVSFTDSQLQLTRHSRSRRLHWRCRRSMTDAVRRSRWLVRCAGWWRMIAGVGRLGRHAATWRLWWTLRETSCWTTLFTATVSW